MMFNQRIIEMTVAARVLEIYCNVENTLPPLPAQLSKEWIERNQKVYFVKRKHSEQSFWITIKTITELTALIHLKWQSCGFYQI